MQIFANKLLYSLFIIALVFGVILQDVIGFKSTDEICGMILLLTLIYSVFHSKDWEINKAFLITLIIFAFYTGYSFWIGSNAKQAIFMDLIIQMKPYLAFFCFYQLKPQFTPNQKYLLKQLSLLLWFILLPIGILGFFSPALLKNIMGHPTYFAASITALSLVYLYSSDYTKKDKLIFILLMTIGLASGRSKFYGFYALSISVLLYLENPQHLKFNIKNSFFALLILSVIIFITKDKLMYYFGDGLTGEENNMDYIARFVLYATSFKIFTDFFPFGSGLASFATHSSGYYYSPIYSQYGIDNVWGISKNNWSFIADTYYPSLAQFGIAGVALFILFWLYLLKKAYNIFLINKSTKVFSLILLITGYCLIENIADASFTSNRGFFMLMFMGLILSEKENKVNKEKVVSEENK